MRPAPWIPVLKKVRFTAFRSWRGLQSRARTSPHVQSFLMVVTTLSIGDAGQQPGSCGDGPAKTATSRILREKCLRVLLASASGNVEVGIEQQRVAGRDSVGDYAERVFAIIPAACPKVYK